MRQVGYLPELYEDVRSEKYKIEISLTTKFVSLDYRRTDTLSEIS